MLPSLHCCERHRRLMALWPWYHRFVYESNGLWLQWLALWVVLTLATTKMYPLNASSLVSSFYTHRLPRGNHWQWKFCFSLRLYYLFFPFLFWILSWLFFCIVHVIGFVLIIPLPYFDAVDNNGGLQKVFFSTISTNADTGNPYYFFFIYLICAAINLSF